ncbi:hypothetical protein DF122_16605 [Burkholderia pseudomallei]|nr:hypothetical protein BOC37_02250 [Burkholderia pseudomallei]ARK72146.1 hypothetical protein BOC38_31135 [Burkholderia pseudomallei]ARK75056.1 hypothetical protein BOC39_11550 [Burkholderia pseudomallei]ARK92895.1 hypothetical protein BOC42_29265 [Burkholderia pseudomallei]ARL07374.1 hypothetical protein BOC44_35890 [Burkholderia pseudomallei]
MTASTTMARPYAAASRKPQLSAPAGEAPRRRPWSRRRDRPTPPVRGNRQRSSISRLTFPSWES